MATLKESLEMACVEEAGYGVTAKDMVQNIVDDFTKLTEELKEGMSLAAETGDETTGDMLLAIHQSLEKHNWMLKAYLGK